MPDRQKQTAKSALLQAMEDLLHKKPFSRISVNELCEYAKISRSSFYLYYEDKYQLFSCCMGEKHKLLEQLKIAYSPKEFLMHMFDFIQNEKRFFYNAFGSSDDEEIKEIAYQFFYQEFSGILDQKIRDGITVSGPVEMVAAFYIGGLTVVIIRWIKSNYKFSKEELAACLYDLLNDFV